MLYTSNHYESVQSKFGVVRLSYSNVDIGARHLLDNEMTNRDESIISSSVISRMEKSEIGKDISFLASFLNFFYYLLLVPFKAVLDENSSQYRIQTDIFHKIFCPIVHAVVVFSIIFLWMLSFFQFENNLEPTIVVMFNFFDCLANTFSTITTIFILWRKRDTYLQLIECTRVTMKQGKAIKILFYVGIVMSSASWLVINWFFLHDAKHQGSLHNILEKYIPGRNHSSDGDLLQNLLNVLFVHAGLFYIVAFGPIFMLVLSLWQIGIKFGVELDTTTDIQGGTQLYRQLKRITNRITKLYGTIVLSYYISCVCYYAEAPHVLLGKRGDTEKAFMAYYAITGVVWILAAEFHKNILETVLNWIAFHTEKADLSIEDRLKLVAICNEMSADPVALSSRYFYVTYQQFSSMLGLVVTYGIVVFQIQNGPNHLGTS